MLEELPTNDPPSLGLEPDLSEADEGNIQQLAVELEVSWKKLILTDVEALFHQPSQNNLNSVRLIPMDE